MRRGVRGGMQLAGRFGDGRGSRWLALRAFSGYATVVVWSVLFCSAMCAYTHVLLLPPPPFLSAEDMERAREVYRACLKLLPHKVFTFGKVRPSAQPRLCQLAGCMAAGMQARIHVVLRVSVPMAVHLGPEECRNTMQLAVGSSGLLGSVPLPLSLSC